MLKGIDPLLGADALWALRAMGHGDDLIVADAHFPAEGLARATALGRLIRMEVDAPRAIAAILSVMPVDDTVKDAVARMEAIGQGPSLPDVQRDAEAAVTAGLGAPRAFHEIERFDFYDRARRAFAIIQTGERRFFGCFALRKGLIAPEG